MSRRRKRAPLGASSSTVRPTRPATTPARGWLGRLAAAIHGFSTIEIDPFVLGLFRMALGASFTLRQLRDGRARREMLLGAGKVRVWALKPLQVHLVLVYLLSLPDKLSDSAWTDGTLVYYAMMAVDYARWPGLEIFAWGNAALSRVLTMVSLAVEVLVPALIWFRRFRLPCVLAAVGLHVGMGVMIEA